MTKTQIEKAYNKYSLLLHKLSHQCASRCGRPENEVYGQACYLFMQATGSFIPCKGRFGTYLYHVVSHGLILWGKKMDLPPDPANLPEQRTTLRPDRQLEIKEWLANLSDECCEVATIILNGPAELLELGTSGCRKLTASVIKRYMRKRGWSYPTIWSVMRELKKEVARI